MDLPVQCCSSGNDPGVGLLLFSSAEEGPGGLGPSLLEPSVLKGWEDGRGRAGKQQAVPCSCLSSQLGFVPGSIGAASQRQSIPCSLGMQWRNAK